MGHLVKIDRNQDEVSRLNAKYSAYEKLRGAVPVPPKNYPLLVTFTDINNPTSVKEVKPETMSDILGPGFALKSITLEITNETVTKGKVENVLGWLVNEDDISAFWKSLYAGGFRPSGSIEVKTLFLSEG